MPKKPKPDRVFENIGVREEVLTLLREVETAFEKKHSFRPTHSATLVNALSAYKVRLMAE